MAIVYQAEPAAAADTNKAAAADTNKAAAADTHGGSSSRHTWWQQQHDHFNGG
jgi:hypothetical protein